MDALMISMTIFRIYFIYMVIMWLYFYHIYRYYIIMIIVLIVLSIYLDTIPWPQLKHCLALYLKYTMLKIFLVIYFSIGYLAIYTLAEVSTIGFCLA